MFDKAPVLFIDNEGKWYADEVHMFRMDIVKLFSEHLVLQKDGSYSVEWDGKKYPVKVEDVPFVIDELIINDEETVKARLTDSRIIDFVPKQISGNGDVVHVELFNGLDTRFSRKAQWQLNDYIKEENGEMYLVFGNNRFKIS